MALPGRARCRERSGLTGCDPQRGDMPSTRCVVRRPRWRIRPMKLRSFAVVVASVLGLVGIAAAQSPSAPAADGAKVRTLPTTNKPWTGDADRLLERRMVRVLVPFSRTLYFNDRGHERGLTG